MAQSTDEGSKTLSRTRTPRPSPAANTIVVNYGEKPERAQVKKRTIVYWERKIAKAVARTVNDGEPLTKEEKEKRQQTKKEKRKKRR
jgi:hypothetical protein